MELIEKVKQEALPAVMRRVREMLLSAQICTGEDEEKIRSLASVAFDHALTLATLFHENHKRDGLPEDPHVATLSKEAQHLIKQQDVASMLMLQGEHKMTLSGFFVAIGVPRQDADTVVDHLVATD